MPSAQFPCESKSQVCQLCSAHCRNGVWRTDGKRYEISDVISKPRPLGVQCPGPRHAPCGQRAWSECPLRALLGPRIARAPHTPIPPTRSRAPHADRATPSPAHTSPGQAPGPHSDKQRHALGEGRSTPQTQGPGSGWGAGSPAQPGPPHPEARSHRLPVRRHNVRETAPGSHPARRAVGGWPVRPRESQGYISSCTRRTDRPPASGRTACVPSSQLHQVPGRGPRGNGQVSVSRLRPSKEEEGSQQRDRATEGPGHTPVVTGPRAAGPVLRVPPLTTGVERPAGTHRPRTLAPAVIPPLPAAPPLGATSLAWRHHGTPRGGVRAERSPSLPSGSAPRPSALGLLLH